MGGLWECCRGINGTWCDACCCRFVSKPKDIVGKKNGYIAQQTPESVAEKIKIAKMSPIPKSLLKSRSNDYSADTISLDYIRLIKD